MLVAEPYALIESATNEEWPGQREQGVDNNEPETEVQAAAPRTQVLENSERRLWSCSSGRIIDVGYVDNRRQGSETGEKFRGCR